jgi:8-oxo-dGTP pyrophosphatase MutT (NUDIX family)
MDEDANIDGGAAAAFATYRRKRPQDAEIVALFEQLLRDAGNGDPFRRERLAGHFTGSAWLVSADGERALLLHHRKLDRWLQPGGHADGDSDLAAVALREAEEETGLSGLRVDPVVFDLDRHRIPARGAEPEHWHYDVRFLVHAGADEAFVVNDESHAMAWRPIAEIVADPDVDESVRRLARKSLISSPD